MATEDPWSVGPSGVISDRQLELLGRLHECFEQHAIEYWLFGGWAVDFHVGRVTRANADVDLAVWEVDVAGVDRLLRQEGWDHRPRAGEDGYTEYLNGTIPSTWPSWPGTPRETYTPLSSKDAASGLAAPSARMYSSSRACGPGS
jgi:hypothetical protein